MPGAWLWSPLGAPTLWWRPLHAAGHGCPIRPLSKKGTQPRAGAFAKRVCKSQLSGQESGTVATAGGPRSPARFLVDGKALQSLGPSRVPWLPFPPAALNLGTVAQPVLRQESAAGGVGARSCLCFPAIILTFRDCFCISISVVCLFVFNFTWLQSQIYQTRLLVFPEALKTNDHKLSGLKQQGLETRSPDARPCRGGSSWGLEGGCLLLGASHSLGSWPLPESLLPLLPSSRLLTPQPACPPLTRTL